MSRLSLRSLHGGGIITTPKTIFGSSLKYWVTAQDSGTITKNGSNQVSQWNDKSGSGASNLSGVNNPIYVPAGINGMPSMQLLQDSGFTGGQEFDGTLAATLSSFSAFLVVQINAYQQFDAFLSTYVNTGDLALEMGSTTDSMDVFVNGVGAKAPTSSGILTENVPHMIGVTYDGTNIRIYLGTTQVGSGTYTGGHLNQAIHVGGGNGAYHTFGKYLGELTIADVAATSTQISTLHSYFQSQSWGLNE